MTCPGSYNKEDTPSAACHLAGMRSLMALTKADLPPLAVSVAKARAADASALGFCQDCLLCLQLTC